MARCYARAMRYLRLEHGGLPYWARWIDEQTARLLTGAPYDATTRETDRLVPLDRTRALAPVTPSKIICVGRNYAAHAKELGNEIPSEPLLFFKPPSSLVGPDDFVELPPESARVEYEGELALVIGKRIRRASPTDALDAVWAITAADDITARDLQKKDVQFTRGKGFDTFCPVGPVLETELGDLRDTKVELLVNGAVRQSSSTSALIFDIATLLGYVSQVMTLEPGDLVLTGTPAGVGPLAPGDEVEVRVGSLPPLRHRVRAATV